MVDQNETPTTRYLLSQIYFYLTSDCNLRCRHCWISPDYHGSETSRAALPLDLFKSIVAEARPLGLRGVKLTGGEPLYHPDILKILDFINEQGLGLNIESNGVLCTPEIAKKVASHKGAFMSVSLDGADARAHEWVRGVDGCFDDAVQGIKNLVAAGLRPQVVMTLMRHNKDQIDELVLLAAKLGACSVKFNLVMPTQRGLQMHEKGETVSFEEIVEIGKRVEGTRFPIPVHFSHPPAFRPMSRILGNGGGGCAVCGILNILGVLADGSYALCGIGESIPELIFGKAGVDPLKDVWEKSPSLLELRRGLPSRLEGICGDCLLKNMCMGSCVAQNYYRKRSLWSPFWYCEEARMRDMFPPTRMYTKGL